MKMAKKAITEAIEMPTVAPSLCALLLGAGVEVAAPEVEAASEAESLPELAEAPGVEVELPGVVTEPVAEAEDEADLVEVDEATEVAVGTHTVRCASPWLHLQTR